MKTKPWYTEQWLPWPRHGLCPHHSQASDLNSTLTYFLILSRTWVPASSHSLKDCFIETRRMINGKIATEVWYTELQTSTKGRNGTDDQSGGHSPDPYLSICSQPKWHWLRGSGVRMSFHSTLRKDGTVAMATKVLERDMSKGRLKRKRQYVA